MNSSLRTDAGSGIVPFSRLTPASLKDTSLTFSENVENAFSAVATSGCGTGGGSAAFGGAGGSAAGGGVAVAGFAGVADAGISGTGGIAGASCACTSASFSNSSTLSVFEARFESFFFN